VFKFSKAFTVKKIFVKIKELKKMKKLLFLTLISITSFAQKQPTFDTQLVSDQYLGWWGRTIADMNKDGLQDVVVLKQSRGYGLVSPGWLGWYEAENMSLKTMIYSVREIWLWLI
jgi:hypothetical protein